MHSSIVLPHAGLVSIGDRIALWPVGVGHKERRGTLAALPDTDGSYLSVVLDTRPDIGALHFSPMAVRRVIR